MDASSLGGMVGGIVGGVLGLAGGAIGVTASYRRAGGPRERRFILRMSAGLTAGIALFLTALFLTPAPYRGLLWIPYGLLLPLTIVRLNRRQAEVRAAERGSGEETGPAT